MIFSSLEYIGYFCLLLVLFRFNVKENVVKLLVFSVVLSFVSNTLFTESLRSISPLLHIALFIFIVMFTLRVHFFSATLMVIPSYVIYFTVQWVLIALSLHFNLFDSIVPYTKNAFILQTATATTLLLFAWVTYMLKGGFSFIDHRSKWKRDKIFTKSNLSFIIFMSISIITIFLVNFLFVVSNDPPYFSGSIILIIALLCLIYLAVRKDEKNHG